MKELSPKPIIRYLKLHGVVMDGAEAEIAKHPNNRRYHVSCILAALIRLDDEACEKFTESFATTGHGFVMAEWDKWKKGETAEIEYLRNCFYIMLWLEWMYGHLMQIRSSSLKGKNNFWSCHRIQYYRTMYYWLHYFCGEWEGWALVNRFNHTSGVTVVTPIDRPKSVRNRCVIEILVACLCCRVAFWIFCWCRGFCHKTESDLFLFLLQDQAIRLEKCESKPDGARTKQQEMDPVDTEFAHMETDQEALGNHVVKDLTFEYTGTETIVSHENTMDIELTAIKESLASQIDTMNKGPTTEKEAVISLVETIDVEAPAIKESLVRRIDILDKEMTPAKIEKEAVISRTEEVDMEGEKERLARDVKTESMFPGDAHIKGMTYYIM